MIFFKAVQSFFTKEFPKLNRNQRERLKISTEKWFKILKGDENVHEKIIVNKYGTSEESINNFSFKFQERTLTLKTHLENIYTTMKEKESFDLAEFQQKLYEQIEESDDITMELHGLELFANEVKMFLQYIDQNYEKSLWKLKFNEETTVKQKLNPRQQEQFQVLDVEWRVMVNFDNTGFIRLYQCGESNTKINNLIFKITRSDGTIKEFNLQEEIKNIGKAIQKKEQIGFTRMEYEDYLLQKFEYETNPQQELDDFISFTNAVTEHLNEQIDCDTNYSLWKMKFNEYSITKEIQQ